MKILAIGAHPDDVEFLCAGTLAKYAQHGDEISIMVATNGNVGSPTLSPKEIASIRHEEAQASADILGAKLIWIGIDDEFLFSTRETRMQFIEGIRQAAPDVMFVHSPTDYHPDHRASGQIAIDCRIPVTVPLIETLHTHMSQVPDVYMMDTVGGLSFDPDCFVDVSDTFIVKSEMLSRHKSQAEWLRHIYGMEYVEFMSQLSQQRGQSLGVAHAEAFRRVLTYPLRHGGTIELP